MKLFLMVLLFISCKSHTQYLDDTLHLENRGLKSLSHIDFKKYPNLKQIILSGNQFNFFPKEILKIETLEIINLNDNSLKTIPNEITELKNLRILALNANQIKELPYIKKMEKLQIILLVGNPFTFDEFEKMRCQVYYKTFLKYDAELSYLGVDCPNDDNDG
jgi:hypothetical protein